MLALLYLAARAGSFVHARKPQKYLCRIDAVPSAGRSYAVGAIFKIGFVPVAQNLANGITAETASVQMIVDLQLLIQI